MSEPRLGHPYRLENGIWWFGYRHARNIPDELFLAAMEVASTERAELMGWRRPLGATRWDIEAVLGTGHVNNVYEDVPGVPAKVVLAKAKRLIDRKVIRGCPCGCRGDFEVVTR